MLPARYEATGPLTCRCLVSSTSRHFLCLAKIGPRKDAMDVTAWDRKHSIPSAPLECVRVPDIADPLDLRFLAITSPLAEF